MITLNKAITINGICEIEVDGKMEQIAYLNATISADGKFTINRAIQNQELFNENREEVQLDFNAFDDYVYSESSKYSLNQ